MYTGWTFHTNSATIAFYERDLFRIAAALLLTLAYRFYGAFLKAKVQAIDETRKAGKIF